MRINKFDRSTSHHVADFESDFHLSPITDRGGTNVCVHVFHLQPGGHVGKHAALAAQAFCVVAGEGWVSGEDDERVTIRTGQAAHWSVGEHHAAGSESGLTALVIEGIFEIVAPPVR